MKHFPQPRFHSKNVKGHKIKKRMVAKPFQRRFSAKKYATQAWMVFLKPKTLNPKRFGGGFQLSWGNDPMRRCAYFAKWMGVKHKPCKTLCWVKKSPIWSWIFKEMFGPAKYSNQRRGLNLSTPESREGESVNQRFPTPSHHLDVPGS